jgi:hypothetical protein
MAGRRRGWEIVAFFFLSPTRAPLARPPAARAGTGRAVCNAGTCTCLGGLSYCGGVCVDASVDPAHVRLGCRASAVYASRPELERVLCLKAGRRPARTSSSSTGRGGSIAAHSQCSFPPGCRNRSCTASSNIQRCRRIAPLEACTRPHTHRSCIASSSSRRFRYMPARSARRAGRVRRRCWCRSRSSTGNP